MNAEANAAPRVSVFIASYNHASYLAECLDSILAQTYRDIEIVVVDDGSTDGSMAILEDYQNRFHGKVFVYTHPGHANKGISATCNLAISKTRGEYLAWTGSDDVWYADKLEQQVAQLDEFPEYGMVYSYAQFIDAEGTELNRLYGEDITRDPNPVGRMIQSCHPPAMTVVFKRECLDQVGLFDEGLIYSDWDLFVRIFSHWKVGFIHRPLAKYRMHASNVSKKIDPQVDLQRIIDFTLIIQEKADSIQGALVFPRNLAILNLQLSFLFFCLGDQDRAEKCLKAAFEVDPKLAQDVTFLNAWLNNWKPEFYTLSHQNFNFWLISHFPRNIDGSHKEELLQYQLDNDANRSFYFERGIQLGLVEDAGENLTKIFNDCPESIELPDVWKKEILSEVYVGLLFETFNRKQKSKARYFWLKSIRAKPSQLLNRGVWAIGLRSCFE
jgi:glycosyltransferase involved in cell wall biosynthesis